jgi:hypothetical protein
MYYLSIVLGLLHWGKTEKIFISDSCGLMSLAIWRYWFCLVKNLAKLSTSKYWKYLIEHKQIMSLLYTECFRLTNGAQIIFVLCKYRTELKLRYQVFDLNHHRSPRQIIILSFHSHPCALSLGLNHVISAEDKQWSKKIFKTLTWTQK